MRIFVCFFLTVLCFSLSIQAQGNNTKERTKVNLQEEPLEFNLDIQYLNSEDGRILVEFIFEVDNKDIYFESTKQGYEAKLAFFARVLNINKKSNTRFEDEIVISAKKSELRKIISAKTIYKKIMSFPPDTYRVQVIFKDLTSKRRGINMEGFIVPEKLEKIKNFKINGELFD